MDAFVLVRGASPSARGIPGFGGLVVSSEEFLPTLAIADGPGDDKAWTVGWFSLARTGMGAADRHRWAQNQPEANSIIAAVPAATHLDRDWERLFWPARLLVT